MPTRYRVKQSETDAVQWTGANATEITDLLGRDSSVSDIGAGQWEVLSPVLYAVLKVGDWVLSEGENFRSLPGAYFSDTYEIK